MVLNNQIQGISKQVDCMLLALQKDTNKENEKGNNQKRSKCSFLGVMGDLSEYIFGTVSESTWKNTKSRIEKIAKTNENLVHAIDMHISILRHHGTRMFKKENEISQTIKTLANFKEEIKMLLNLL